MAAHTVVGAEVTSHIDVGGRARELKCWCLDGQEQELNVAFCGASVAFWRYVISDWLTLGVPRGYWKSSLLMRHFLSLDELGFGISNNYNQRVRTPGES